MHTFTSIFVAALFITCALASPIESTEVKEEARTIYDNDNGIYLGLNSTVLWLGVVALVGLAVLLIVLQQSGALNEFASSGYQQRYDQQYYQQGQEQYRTKRSFDENMVTKMLQLEQIFKKYEVEEDECRAYIACEAANVERLAENGPIVQKTHELFNAINYAKPQHLAKFSANKGMMIMKQAYDHAKANQHEVDVCAPLRNACSALRQKKN